MERWRERRPGRGARQGRWGAAALVMLLALPLAALPAPAAPQPEAVSGVDLSVAASDIAFGSAYVMAGDSVWVNTTVFNLGDTGANATLQLFAGDPASATPFEAVPFTVAGSGSAAVSGNLDTTGLEGIRWITARIVGISPAESGGAADDEARAPLRVHTVADQLWQGNSTAVIDTPYNQTGFVTVTDSASLTLAPGGSLLMEQAHDGEFDVLVEGNGALRVEGGSLSSPFALTVELADNGSLVVDGGATFAASLHATSAGTVTLGRASIVAQAFDVDGASTLVDGTDLSVGQATFAAGTLQVEHARLAGAFKILGGVAAAFNDSDVRLEKSVAGAAQAELLYPGISAYLGSGAAPYQPAVSLSGASTADFTMTSVESTVWVGSVALTSTVPVVADGGALATVYRVAHVSVTDPIGAPVRNATVEVSDYFGTGVVASAVAVNGSVEVPLKSDLLASGRANAVGHYRVVARRAAVAADPVPLLFPLYPDLAPGSLGQDVPVVLALFAPWGLYAEDVPAAVLNESTISGERVFSSSVEVRTPVVLDGANITLLQTHPFERYVVVTDTGSLEARQSAIRSAYPFDLYVLNGTSASFNESALLNGNLLFSAAGGVSLQGARVLGSAIGNASSFSCDGSYLWGRLLEVTAASVLADDCVMAATDLVALGGGPLALTSVGIGATFDPFDAENETVLPFASFDAAAGTDTATAQGAPAVRLEGPSLAASGLTVWTGGSLTLALGGGNSTIAGARLLVGGVAFALAGSNVSESDALIAPGASVSYAGSGAVQLRAVASPAPSIGAGVSVEVYDPVLATVTDGVDLPVAGAVVVAVPQGPVRPTESAVSDGSGTARLLLLSSLTLGGVTSRGPVYRVNATLGGEVSPTVSWDATQSPEVAFRLSSTFASVSGEASFALVAPLGGLAYRVLATNLDNGSLAPFFLSFNSTAFTFNFTAPVYPLQPATLFVAADYDYVSGPLTVSRPMAGEPGALEVEGATLANFTLDADGLASVPVVLPQAAGLVHLNASVAASKLASPLVLGGSMQLAPLSKLFVEASLSKRTVKPSFELIVVGTVRDETGATVAGANVTVTFAPSAAPRSARTAADGSFLVKVVAPADLGNYTVRVVASRQNALDADPALFPYTVSAAGAVAPGTSTGAAPNFLVLALGGVVFVGSAAGLVFAWTQRRVARGEFVVCGNCEKPTLAADRKCRNCGVEFEATVAKCSKCGSWISPDATSCPQCHTQFVRRAEPAAAKDEFAVPPPTSGVPAGFDIPEAVPLTGKKLGPARLEDMEFRLPGTSETLELADKGDAPSFPPAPNPGGARPPPAPSGAAAAPPASVGHPLERMELPHHVDEEAHVREVSAMEGGEPTAKEPVSLGSGNIDLSRTTAAATSTKPDVKGDDQIPEDVLRELLMKAAPELTGEMLPGDIRRELAEIARSEAPVASEKRASLPARAPPGPGASGTAPASPAQPARAAGPLPPDERTAEAPEKSRKTAFDVFSTPTKNIPAGYERKGAGPPKEAAGKAAPVCPNCGGNWVVQRDGKNSCRVCGTRW